MCWWQNETLKMASSKNLQCEPRGLLLRAKQQVSMFLDRDHVNNVEMFKMDWSEQLCKCEEIALTRAVARRPRGRMTAGSKAQGGGLLHIRNWFCYVVVISYCIYHGCSLGMLYITEQGGQTKVFQFL